MVKHVVLWTIKDGYDKRAVFDEIKGIFDGFASTVPGMRSCELFFGHDGYDICLISTHDSREAVEAYQNFPAHKAAKEVVAAYRAERASCDFDII
ncbi:hypothetical protein FACS189499_06340 [Clostridia bacterium]|nr:hypothetical protein FACS189499_06340 [Clostridia bacterium]